MSGIPAEIADLGATVQRLSQNPGFDPLKAGLSTEEYFVWSRFDGATTLRDLLLMTGFDTDRAVGIVRRLRGLGAILLPGERPAQVAALVAAQLAVKAAPQVARPAAQPAPVIARPAPARSGTAPVAPPAARSAAPVAPAARPPSGPIGQTPTGKGPALPPEPPNDEVAALRALGEPSLLERAMLAEAGELDLRDRARILAMHRRIHDPDAHALLGVAADADRRTTKLTYFRLSKDFHPDRFYGRQLGSFARLLSDIFEALARAYADLTEAPTVRSPRTPVADDSQPQTPVEYAAELYERGCTHELSGDTIGALRLFDAAIRVDGQVRYLRRAAECALSGDEGRAAETYAKKAAALEPLDASIQRLLARVFRAAGRFGDAEEVLLMAMQLKVDSDALVRELRADLADVRRQLARNA